MNNRLALVVVIFYTGMQAIGQTTKDLQRLPVLEIPIHQYTPAEGLSQGFASDLAIDYLGYLWIATKEGLNRFDGRTFKKFTHSAKDPSSIAENYTTSLLAQKNKIWVGTNSGMLDCFDLTTEKFTHIRLKGSGPDGSDQNIRSIIPAGEHTILANHSNRYKIIQYKQQNNGPDIFLINDLEDNYPWLRQINVNPSVQKKIVAFSDDKLYMQIADSFFEYSATGRKLLYAFERKKNDLHGNLFSWKNTSNNEIFLRANNELFKYNTTNQKFIKFMELPDSLGFSYDMFSDNEGRIWTTNKDRSFIRIDVAKKDFDIIKPLASGFSELIKREDFNFTSHTTDAAGNIWLGSNGYGIIKLSPFALNLKKNNTSYNSNFSAGWQLRFSQNGLHAKYNAEVIDKYLKLLEKSDLYKKGFRKSVIDEHFALDAEGNYWFNLIDVKFTRAFVIKMNGITGAYTIAMQKSLDNNFREFQPIYCDRKNKIWVCEATSSKTVHIYNIDAHTGQQQTFTLPKLQKSFIESRVVTDILDDADGNLWFASYMGLFKLSPITKTWSSIQEGINTFSSNKLISLCEDPLQPDKYLWIGNDGGGLYQLDKGNAKITEYTTADGLPNNVIYSIQPDAHNNLWLSTNNGICLFNPSTKTCSNFNKSHGLEGLEFNRYQFSRSNSGEIYLGGVGFSIHFNPQDFYRATPSAKIVINGLKVGNKEISLLDEEGKKDPLIHQAIDFTTKLVLDHDESILSLRFNLLDFTNPSSNHYRYKLAGLNNNWIDIGTNNEAVFTNLQPREYTFFASGNNGDGNWSEPAKIILQILPAWWQTWWFKMLSISMFVLLIYFFLKYRFKKQLEVEKIRNRIAQDLHDEIGSTLSSLGIYSAALSKTIYSKPDNAQQILDKISTSATHMMESMKDIVWSVNPSNDSLPILIARMRSFAASVSESANVNLHFETNMGESKKKLSMLDRKNLYLVFKEAVTNSIKHSGCKNLWVTLIETRAQTMLDVRDDGKGFKAHNDETGRKQLSGNGMSSMHARAKESKARFIVMAKEKGSTTIQFILEK